MMCDIVSNSKYLEFMSEPTLRNREVCGNSLFSRSGIHSGLGEKDRNLIKRSARNVQMCVESAVGRVKSPCVCL